MKIINSDHKELKGLTKGKKYTFGSVTITALCISLALLANKTNKEEIKTSQNNISTFEEYAYQYDKISKSIDVEFDDKFQELYDDSRVSINGKTSHISELYILTFSDGSIRLVNSNDRKVDYVTGEQIIDEKDRTMRFRDTSMFYNMYLDGLFTDNLLNITSDTLYDYINKWDLSKHTAIEDLYITDILENNKIR